MTSFMKIDFDNNKDVKEKISRLIESEVKKILEELGSLDHLKDFVKIIMICLSVKYKGDETKLKKEFMDIFEQREDLVNDFIAFLKNQIPKNLPAKIKRSSRESEDRKNRRKRKIIEEGQKSDESHEEKTEKKRKNILDRLKPAKKKGDRKGDKRRDDRTERKRGKRSRSEFEDDFSDEEYYRRDRRGEWHFMILYGLVYAGCYN